MSITRINQYYKDLERIKARASTQNELAIKSAFKNLLNDYCRSKDLEVIEEQTIIGSAKRPDGVVVDAFKFRYGYWEAKDAKDDLEKEIIEKQRSNYPMFNFLIENSIQAILIQGESKEKINVTDKEALHRILSKFIAYEREEVKEFKQAITQFQTDLPQIIEVLREMIGKQTNSINPTSALPKGRESKTPLPSGEGLGAGFTQARQDFFVMCQEAINPNIKLSDIDEMLIQHILTEDIFKAVFDDEVFHEENNIAKALKKIEKTFFSGDVKRQTLAASRPYYAQIKARATEMQDYSQKQDFLKGIYENFYKAYNPKAADTLGIVYTPKEIVNFMLESTDYLLEKHFGKTLSDKNVHILDPATGTGTFITDLLNYLPKQDLDYKYRNEIHANEVAILPYYIANLNIEYTYKNRMQNYVEFPNLCWVDTLDSTGGLAYAGKKGNLFGVTAENTQRIKNQNEQKISVIIGNPPYNANQQNENDNNKNRTYEEIDQRIKDTFIKESTAQKTKVYDTYVRFYRWAMDRVNSNEGIVCFVTNSSFIDARTFDGFRKSIQTEFDFAYIIDFGGDIRKLSGKDGIWMNEEHTIFGKAAAVGIAILFLVKKGNSPSKRNCQVNYIQPCDMRATRIEKFGWIKSIKNFGEIDFERVRPDKNNNWINLTDNDFESLIPVCSKAKTEQSIFSLSSLGVSTNRDQWVYDFSKKNLEKKIQFFIQQYNDFLDKNDNSWDTSIKWSEYLKGIFKRKQKLSFDEKLLTSSNYRPFSRKFYYAERFLSDRLTQNHYDIFGNDFDKENRVIAFKNLTSSKDFFLLATNIIPDLHFTGDTNSLPLYRYENGERVENITDWALDLFRGHYGSSLAASPADALLENELLADKKLLAGSSTTAKVLEKTDIFHYVYAVLHKPEYRTKYEQNLKREFPRIPLYPDFWKYAEAGRKLMDLHLNYENLNPTPALPKGRGLKDSLPLGRAGVGLMERKDLDLEVFKVRKQGKKKKTGDADKEVTAFETAFTVYPILKIKDNNIEIDELTTLCGVPAEALAYKLGNRSAIEWILDQYKPYKSDDKTIQEQFNNYNFADYKEQVIDLLQKVCFVSVETMKIVGKL